MVGPRHPPGREAAEGAPADPADRLVAAEVDEGGVAAAFGRHNQYNFLPHVAVVTDESDLKEILHAALGHGARTPEARASGARFLQAVCDESFDLRDYNYIKLDRFEPRVVDDAVASLERSFELVWNPSKRSLRALS